MKGVFCSSPITMQPMLLASKSTSIGDNRRHLVVVQSQNFRPPNRPLSLNLRVRPDLHPPGRYSLKRVAAAYNLKSSKSGIIFDIQKPDMDIQFQPNYKDPPPAASSKSDIFDIQKPKEKLESSPILNLIKKCAIGLVMMAVLLMSNLVCSWAASGRPVGSQDFQSSSLVSSSSSSTKSSSSSSSTKSSSSTEDPSSSTYQLTYWDHIIIKAAVGLFWISLFALGYHLLMSCVALVALTVLSCQFVWKHIAYLIALVDLEKTSVLMLQIGFLGTARSLQRDLDRISQTASTSTTQGLSHMLKNITHTLMCHSNYCISAYSSAHFKRSTKGGEKLFHQLSKRAKVNDEILLNVNNLVMHRPSNLTAVGFSNECTVPSKLLNKERIVVTILVAIQGNHVMPTIKGIEDVKNALQQLKSITASQIKAVEVLWAPQADGALSDEEYMRDYLHLVPLHIG